MRYVVRSIPKSIKIIFSLFLLLLIPSFWRQYGLSHFLWLSHVMLLVTYVATIFESRFLASMAATGYLAYAIGWTIDFIYTLIFPSIGFTGYMLDGNIPVALRVISLFHIALIPYLSWLVFRLCYDKRAWPFQIALSSLLLFLTWALRVSNENINLARSYQEIGWRALPYLMLLCLVNAMIIFSTHRVLMKICKKKIV